MNPAMGKQSAGEAKSSHLEKSLFPWLCFALSTLESSCSTEHTFPYAVLEKLVHEALGLGILTTHFFR
jgi:hypothetical protein